ncbi:hypothetical protein V8C86DRAFT_2575027, partial [Haematococcus lacustris]
MSAPLLSCGMAAAAPAAPAAAAAASVARAALPEPSAACPVGGGGAGVVLAPTACAVEGVGVGVAAAALLACCLAAMRTMTPFSAASRAADQASARAACCMRCRPRAPTRRSRGTAVPSGPPEATSGSIWGAFLATADPRAKRPAVAATAL